MDGPALVESAEVTCAKRQAKFQQALEQSKPDEALRQFALCFEETFAAACVDANGNKQKLPADCWKRCRNKIKKEGTYCCSHLEAGW